MCEPITIAVVGGLALGTAGTAYTAYEQNKQGQDQRKADLKNSLLAEEAAVDSENRGAIAAQLERQRGTQMIGAQKVAYAASGVNVGEGTPVEVMARTRAMSELDALTTQNNAAREAWGYRTQGLQYRQQAEFSARRGRSAATGTLLTGSGNLVAGGANAYSAYGSRPSTTRS